MQEFDLTVNNEEYEMLEAALAGYMYTLEINYEDATAYKKLFKKLMSQAAMQQQQTAEEEETEGPK